MFLISYSYLRCVNFNSNSHERKTTNNFCTQKNLFSFVPSDSFRKVLSCLSNTIKDQWSWTRYQVPVAFNWFNMGLTRSRNKRSDWFNLRCGDSLANPVNERDLSMLVSESAIHSNFWTLFVWRCLFFFAVIALSPQTFRANRICFVWKGKLSNVENKSFIKSKILFFFNSKLALKSNDRWC